jgi:DNA repair protein RadD
VLVLAHRAELIEQLTGTVRAWGLEPDVIAPGHRLQGRQVAVGSVQTVARRLGLLPVPDLIIQDEAHHLVAGNVWGRIIEAWPGAHLIGKTATPERLDGKGLGIEAGGYFEALVLGPSAAWLVEQGWLVRPKVFCWPGARNSKLHRRMREFDLEQAARAFGDRAAIGDAVSHYRRRLHPGTAICFCCTIEHAEQMAAAFRAAGIRAASVSGGTPAEERKRLIAGLGTGEVEVLSSCMIISEGTDIPSVGGAILMRPTASLSLYLQMVGRALRPAPGKNEAVILDHDGNAHHHGLPTDEREWNLAGRRRRVGVSIPIKDCPVCFCSCPSAAQVCPDCGHLFLAEERDEQRRGLQQLEGELGEVTGAARHRLKPNQQQRPRRTHRQQAARPSSSCCSASRSAATSRAGPGMCGPPGNAAHSRCAVEQRPEALALTAVPSVQAGVAHGHPHHPQPRRAHQDPAAHPSGPPWTIYGGGSAHDPPLCHRNPAARRWG